MIFLKNACIYLGTNYKICSILLKKMLIKSYKTTEHANWKAPRVIPQLSSYEFPNSNSG